MQMRALAAPGPQGQGRVTAAILRAHLLLAGRTVTVTADRHWTQVRETHDDRADEALLDGFHRLKSGDARECRRLGTVASVVTQTK